MNREKAETGSHRTGSKELPKGQSKDDGRSSSKIQNDATLRTRRDTSNKPVPRRGDKESAHDGIRNSTQEDKRVLRASVGSSRATTFKASELSKEAKKHEPSEGKHPDKPSSNRVQEKRQGTSSSLTRNPSITKPNITDRPTKDANTSRNKPPTAQMSGREGKTLVRVLRKEEIVPKSKIPDTRKSLKNVTPVLPLKNEVSFNGKRRTSDINKNLRQVEGDLQGGGDSGRLSRERTRTRTINPGDSQLLTALQEAAQKLPQDVEPVQKEMSAGGENDYEDDFEDYESDFGEMSESGDCSENHSSDISDEDDDNSDEDATVSSKAEPKEKTSMPGTVRSSRLAQDEEKKMDSGHYDLGDRLGQRHKIKEIKDIVEKDNSAVLGHRAVASLEPVRQYVGFEVSFINFASAKKRQQEKRVSSNIKLRGGLLLSMIRLDSVSFSLYDVAPVPYEVYMRSYGRSNTQQVYCQTNEDRLSEEVQTDLIKVLNKWTQHPPALLHLENPSESYLQCCAVASDPSDAPENLSSACTLNVNVVRLEQFLLSAGQVVLGLLEESLCGTHGLLRSNKVDLGFSQGFIMLNVESIPFLANRPVTFILFLPHQPNSLLTVHASVKQMNSTNDAPIQSLSRCILCVWSIFHPSLPVRMLVSSADVTSCSLHPTRPSLLFTGLQDGLISVWDLKERNMFHQKIQFQQKEWILQSPTYTTAGHCGTRHSAAVVGIQVLEETSGTEGEEVDLAPAQVCSVDETGTVIVWTLLSGMGGGASADDAGLAPWGSVHLLLSSSFSVLQHINTAMSDHFGNNLQCSDLQLDVNDAAHMYVATNIGYVVHCLKSGIRVHPSLYKPNWDCLSTANCISPCPFGLPYFLVGCSDGTVRLHTQQSDKPLLSVGGTGTPMGYGPQIISVQWSKTRPCVFFALDDSSRLHVWDLGTSDMYPLFTVPFKGRTISTMQLSPASHIGKSGPYLALGTSCGKVKVHLLKAEFGMASHKETAIELDKFKRYVSIL